MTLARHIARSPHDVCCEVIDKLKQDAELAKRKSRFKKGCWLRFAITPEGVKLPVQLGTPDRPFQSSLKLDEDGLVNEEMLLVALRTVRVDRVYFGRLERFPSNPFLGITAPYFELTLEVRRF